MVNINPKCSPQGMATFYCELSGDQRKLIDASVFGPLFQIPKKAICSGKMLAYLVKCYLGKGNFIIGGTKVRFTLKDVALILGLKVTEFQSYVQFEGSSTKSNFKDKIFPRGGQVTRQEILDVCFGNVGKDEKASSLNAKQFLQMSYIYSLGSFLFPNSHLTIEQKFFTFVDNVQAFDSYPWGNHVYDTILESVQKCKDDFGKGKKMSNMYGCAYALQIWAYEHILGMGPKLLEVKSPRVLKWDVLITNRKEKKINEAILNNKIIIDLTPTREELHLLDGLVKGRENKGVIVIEEEEKRGEDKENKEQIIKLFEVKQGEEIGSDEERSTLEGGLIRRTRLLMCQPHLLTNEKTSMRKGQSRTLTKRKQVMELKSKVTEQKTTISVSLMIPMKLS